MVHPRSVLFHVLTALGLVLHGAPIHAQSFTQTFGDRGAQDGIGGWSATTGFNILVRQFDEAAHRYSSARFSTSTSGSSLTTSGFTASLDQFLQQVVLAPDGHVFAVGSRLRGEPAHHDPLVIKLNNAGEVVWTSEPEIAGAQQLFGGVALPDGGAVLCGLSSDSGPHQAYVVRLNASGELDWSYTLSTPAVAEAFAVAMDGDEFVLTGRQATFSGSDDMLLFRLTGNGQLLWSTSFGGSAMDVGRAAVATAPGTVVVAGWTNSVGAFDVTSQRRPYRAYMAAFDVDGDTLWTRAIGDTTYDQRAYAMVPTLTGDFYLVGDRGTSALSDAVLMRITSQGTVVWQRVLDLGKEERFTHVTALPDGVLATGWSFGEFGRQVLFVKRGPDGN